MKTGIDPGCPVGGIMSGGDGGSRRPVVAAAAQGGWDRVVVAFQPHRYSRTEDLWRDFGPVFDGADVVVVADVDGAGEQPRPGITGQLVVDAVRAARPALDVRYEPDRRALADHLAGVLRPGDLCLTLGAGDVTGVPDELLRRLADADDRGAGGGA